MQGLSTIGKCCDCKGIFEKHQLLETIYYDKICLDCAILLCHDCGLEVESLTSPTCVNCGERKVRPYIICGNRLLSQERKSRIEYALKRIASIFMQNNSLRPPSSQEEIPSRV